MEAFVNGVWLRYVDRGAGPAILFIHGFPFSSAMWQPQIAALHGRYRVIAPDLRGFGASSVPSGPYMMETFADDLAVLLDHLGIQRVVLCGLSMGGYVAFAFWRRYAYMVHGLILADTRAGADSEQARTGRMANIELVQNEGAAALADRQVPNLLAPTSSAAVQAQVRSYIERTQPAGIVATLQGLAARPDSSDLLPQINVPTLILVGANDSITPPDEARSLQAAISGSRLVEIPAAGHVTNLEQPDIFNAALSEFLVTII